MYLVIAFLCKTNKISELVVKMRERGYTGGTIIDGAGMRRVMPRAFDVPLIASLDSIFDKEGELNKVLFSVVENENEVKELMDMMEEVFGNLHQPSSGLAISIKLDSVRGYDRWKSDD